MQRRDFMKAALAATVAGGTLSAQTAPLAKAVQKTVAPGPLPWMSGIDHIDSQSVRVSNLDNLAVPEGQFFNGEQMQTLRRLSDVLLPAINGKPGAIEAKAPEFLDFLVGKSSEETQHTYRTGLDWLEQEAQQRYSKSFTQLDSVQSAAVLKPHLTTWMPDQYPEGPTKRFVAMAHDAIRTSTHNSQAWAEATGTAKTKPAWAQQVYWYPVEGEFA